MTPRGGKRKYFWTEEQDEFIRQHYDGNAPGRVAWIAEQLGGVYPNWQVKKRAGVLGLTVAADRRNWTEVEEKFLRDYLCSASANYIAKKLKRSLASVMLKSKREKIRRVAAREGYTMRLLEQSFGMDHRVIRRWIDEDKLKAKKRGINGKRDTWHFTERDVLEFVIAYPLEFRLDKVNQAWFMELVTGGRENAERSTVCVMCERFPGDDPVVLHRPTGENGDTMEIWIYCRGCGVAAKKRAKKEEQI